MLPGLDPKKMQAMMKQMGIKQEDFPTKRVIIEGEEKNIIIENASAVKTLMSGQVSWQISGDEREESKEPQITQDDIKLVMEKANCSEDKAKQVLEESKGDIAEAIMKASE